MLHELVAGHAQTMFAELRDDDTGSGREGIPSRPATCIHALAEGELAYMMRNCSRSRFRHRLVIAPVTRPPNV